MSDRSDRNHDDRAQEDEPLTPDLAALHEHLLAEGERWRRDELSTTRLEQHLQALAQRDANHWRNGGVLLAERDAAYPTQQTPRDLPPRLPARSPRHGWLPFAAAVLLVALAGSTFALFGPRRAGQGTRTTATASATALTRVTAVRPAQLHLPLPAGSYLTDISFSSAHDGWAVGGTQKPPYQPGQPSQDFSGSRSVLIHYHDGVWTLSSDTMPNAAIVSVSMVSADDGWAVGMIYPNPNSNMDGTAFLLHYTGGHWQRVDPPALRPTGYVDTNSSYTIHMLSPDFGYIAGTIGVRPPGTNTAYAHMLVLVYQHGAWSSIPNTFELSGGFDVAMVSPDEGWVTIGVSGSTSAFYHYLDGVWTKATTYRGGVDTMHVVTPRDIWAMGLDCMGQGEQQQCEPLVYHFDGVSWAPQVAPIVQGFDWSHHGTPIMTTDASGDMWVSLDSYFAQGQGWHFRDYLYTYARGIWTRASLPVTDGAVLVLTSDGNGGTWAVVMGGAPSYANYVLYAPSTTWSVYGQS